MASASPPTTRRAAQLLLQLARDHRRILGGAVLGGIGWQLAGIVVPVVIGWTIDRGIVEGDRQAIWLGVLAMVGLGAVEAGCAALRHWMACRADMAAGASVRLALTDAALRLDEDAADRFPPGEVIARETSDGATVAGLFDAVGHTVAEAISVPVITVVLLLIDPALGLVVGLLIPVSIVLMWRSSVVWERRSAKVQAAMGRAVSSAQESVEGFRTIRGIGAEAAAVDRFVTRSASLRDRSVEMGNLWLAFEPALQLATVAAEGLVLWIGGHRVIDGSVGIGEVVTAVSLVLFLSGPLRTLGERVLTVQGALASARRIVDVLDAAAPADGDDRPDPVPGHTVSLEVVGVTVGRPEDDPVLVDGDLILQPGELVVLDGPTGGGKSTVLTAVAGLRQPSAGELRLGGVLADEWPPDRWRRRVLLLGPVPFLFAGTVRDNVTFADSAATDDHIAVALTAAACDFVADLPDGLDTVVGERGVTLSGGQRQRLARARAVLARPSVLLLDGATSALDDATEQAVLHGLRTQLPDTTVVVVTTNRHVRDSADRVVELSDRRLVAP